MKTFLVLFILLFSSSVFADDISDFEIEGMSVGDSLLDYFSEEEIINNVATKKIYPFDGFTINITNYELYSISLINFDAFDFEYKSPEGHNSLIKKKNLERKYIIHRIIAMIDFPDKIDECLVKKNEIVNALDNLIDDPVIWDSNIDHQQDISGNSKVFQTKIYVNEFDFPQIKVECYDWTEEMGFMDHLAISISSQEYTEWVINK